MKQKGSKRQGKVSSGHWSFWNHSKLDSQLALLPEKCGLPCCCPKIKIRCWMKLVVELVLYPRTVSISIVCKRVVVACCGQSQKRLSCSCRVAWSWRYPISFSDDACLLVCCKDSTTAMRHPRCRCCCPIVTLAESMSASCAVFLSLCGWFCGGHVVFVVCV